MSADDAAVGARPLIMKETRRLKAPAGYAKLYLIPIPVERCRFSPWRPYPHRAPVIPTTLTSIPAKAGIHGSPNH